ncbi:MAG: DMT family transporter [Candidatus Aenigmatarchaeota archaeon]|nr:MAG: DMT family transporter [Candidatus Aenigmarchaeota archaeon]
MSREVIGTILALLTAIISGFAIPVNKIFVVDLDPTVFTAVRAVIIGVVFLLLSFATRGFSRESFGMNWKYLALIAIIGGALAFLLFFTGLKFTTGGRAAFLHKTLPLYVAVFAFIFLRERIPKKQIYALILMLIGTLVLFSVTINPADLWMNPQLGDILVVGATILWALENVIARKAMINGEKNFVVSFARMFFGGVILFGVVLLLGKFDLLLSLSMQQWTNIFISTGILFGYVLFWYWSIRYINVSKASTLLLLAPVVSLVLGMWWLNEPAPAVQLLGSALILIGAYFVVGIKSRFASGV